MHTHGPWKVVKLGEFAYVGFADDSYIAKVFNPKNARLIAASPQLLEACELAIETVDDDAPGPGLTERELLVKLRAAIAAAKGE